MSRAIALDELLLQLAESLQRSLRLAAAEVWTGSDGLLERTAAVPDRGPQRTRLKPEELPSRSLLAQLIHQHFDAYFEETGLIGEMNLATFFKPLI